MIILSVSLAGCNSEKDSDDDGIPDRVEKAGWQVAIYTMEGSEIRQVFSDPKKADTDGDGFDDYEEWFRPILGSLDPSTADSDGDGLSDCQEVLHKDLEDCENPDYTGPYDGGYGTDPLMMDSDTAGVARYNNWVVNGGEGYLDELGYRTSNGVYLYGDGLSDYEEVMGYDLALEDGRILRDVRTDPLNSDSDGDGLEDGEERLFGANPNLEDTDGDGCLDGVDPIPGSPERYQLQFGQFTLHDAQSLGGAEIVMQAIVAEQGVNGVEMRSGQELDQVFAPTQGSFRVDVDEPVSLRSLDGEALRLQDCGVALLTPYHPWMFIEVAANHKRGGPSDNLDAAGDNWLDLLDATSQSGQEDSFTFAWNVREGILREDVPRRDGVLAFFDSGLEGALETTADGWLLLEGNEASVQVRPMVV